jgi:ACS family hexuronate transporter-like MFS transporter
VLLLIGAGAMGLFPCYYSFAQDVSPRHLGKASGLLAAIGWLIASPIQKGFGRLIDQTGSFDTGITLAGLAPAVAIAVIMIFWPHASSATADRT